jgi:hypothetical protein
MPLHLGVAGGTKFSSERTACDETGCRTLVLWNFKSVGLEGQVPRKKNSLRLEKHGSYSVGLQGIIRLQGWVSCGFNGCLRTTLGLSYDYIQSLKLNQT